MSELPSTISELRPDTKGATLQVQVIDAKVVRNRPKVAEALVGDASGTILMSARNEQADLAVAGAYLTLQGAKVEMYRGSMRLAVDQAGKVETAEGISFKPLKDLNMSLVEFELITLPTAGLSPASIALDSLQVGV